MIQKPWIVKLLKDEIKTIIDQMLQETPTNRIKIYKIEEFFKNLYEEEFFTFFFKIFQKIKIN